MRPVLLLTRPRDASDRFAGDLPREILARVQVIISPLIEIIPLVQSLDLNSAKGLILTSANAVRVARTITTDRTLPCFCVGEATAAAARDAGWVARKAGATADALVAALTKSPPATPLLHLSGRHVRGDVAGRLTQAGVPTRQVAIYDQSLTGFSEPARAALDGDVPVIAPLFSPRTARHFVELTRGAARIHAVCLSDAVSEPLKSGHFASRVVSERPDSVAMTKAVAECLDGISRVEGRGSAQ